MDRIADLAKLRAPAQEREKIAAQMQEMITFANQLGELDTSGVEPMAHVIPISNVFRKDQPIPSFEREALLQNAPKQLDGYYFVPRVVE